jgi:hypothetical protein
VSEDLFAAANLSKERRKVAHGKKSFDDALRAAQDEGRGREAMNRGEPRIIPLEMTARGSGNH